MKNLSFYEQAGIVVPGAVLLFGLFLIQPDLHDILAKDGITIGALGIFILLAYATGHLVAALGNVLEKVLWWPFGGMPSNWVTDPNSTLADLLTPLLVANPFLAIRATLLWWLGDKFEYGLPHGWQSWLRRWTVDSFFPVSLF